MIGSVDVTALCPSILRRMYVVSAKEAIKEMELDWEEIDHNAGMISGRMDWRMSFQSQNPRLHSSPLPLTRGLPRRLNETTILQTQQAAHQGHQCDDRPGCLDRQGHLHGVPHIHSGRHMQEAVR